MTLAKTSERFHMRLRWVDDTQETTTVFDRFRDGVAVQFSLGDDVTSQLMGDGPESAVNIWYWRSGQDEVQNLAAGGFGSTTILEEQPVSGKSQYADKDGDLQESFAALPESAALSLGPPELLNQEATRLKHASQPAKGSG